jgi:hypothetical protein
MKNRNPDRTSKSGLPDDSWGLDDGLGEPSRPSLNVENDDANHLYIAAEEDFPATIPMILEELSANRSTNLRETAIYLLDCYAHPRYAHHVLKSLRMEHTYVDKAVKGIYVNALLTFGEVMLKPMLNVWADSEADGYSRDVAKQFLSVHLAR